MFKARNQNTSLAERLAVLLAWFLTCSFMSGAEDVRVYDCTMLEKISQKI